MADSSILDGNRWPHWGQFCGLSTPARVDLRGGPSERLEPACGCNSSARSINSYDIAGLILPWFYLASHFRIFPGFTCLVSRIIGQVPYQDFTFPITALIRSGQSER